MQITELHLHAEHEPSSCLRLFFAGFGQDPQSMTEVLQVTSQEILDRGDPWIAEDLKLSPDIVMISGYTKADKEAVESFLQRQDGYVTELEEKPVDTSSLELSSVDGVEIAFHAPVEPELSEAEQSLQRLQQYIDKYETVEIVAWSFGVRAACSLCRCLHIPEGKLHAAVALAGTIPAVDKHYGISPRACALTLRMLNESTWQQFQKNMCLPTEGRDEDLQHGEAVYTVLAKQNCNRSLDSLREELAVLPEFPLDEEAFDMSFVSTEEKHTPSLLFTQIFISEADGIFPAKAQQQYWLQYKQRVKEVYPSHKCEVLGFSMPHLSPQALLNALTAAQH